MPTAAKKKTTAGKKRTRKRKPKATRPASTTPPASFDALLTVRPDDAGVLGLLPLLGVPTPLC